MLDDRCRAETAFGLYFVILVSYESSNLALPQYLTSFMFVGARVCCQYFHLPQNLTVAVLQHLYGWSLRGIFLKNAFDLVVAGLREIKQGQRASLVIISLLANLESKACSRNLTARSKSFERK